MKFNILNAKSQTESSVADKAIKSVFAVKKLDVDKYLPDDVFNISINTDDSSVENSYNLSVSNLQYGNNSYVMLTLKNLAQAIFGEYVDPREIISEYIKLHDANTIKSSALVVEKTKENITEKNLLNSKEVIPHKQVQEEDSSFKTSDLIQDIED
jgi:hypothetical protein